jgi:hypothetical protein
MLERGHTAGAKLVTEELRRDWRGNKQGEFAALVMESLCADQDGEPCQGQAGSGEGPRPARCLERRRQEQSGLGETGPRPGARLPVTGDEENARDIVRKVAAENHEDRAMIAQVQSIYAKTGKEADGQALLAQVGREIVELNNRGVLAARRGDVEGSVKLLMEAAERVPNLQFLVNATKAIFTLLERKGWDPALAKRGLRFLQLAQARDMRNAGVISARDCTSASRASTGCGGSVQRSANPGRPGRRLVGGRWQGSHCQQFVEKRRWPARTGLALEMHCLPRLAQRKAAARRECTGHRSPDSPAARVERALPGPRHWPPGRESLHCC